MAYKTNLVSSTNANFDSMIKRFGIVTVMEAKVYESLPAEELRTRTAYQIIKQAENGQPLCILDTLKIANVTMEGPTKTITGGQYSNPLIKFGKTARLEMQDALGNAQALEALCGGVVELKDGNATTGIHFGSDFTGPKMIIGDTFFIDQHSGQQVKVKIVFYQFLPDSLFNLTQDAEGDATVFDMNGDLLVCDIKLGNETMTTTEHGVFYSIVDENEVKSTTSVDYYTIAEGKILVSDGYTGTLDGATISASGADLPGEEEAARLIIRNTSNIVVVDTVIQG